METVELEFTGERIVGKTLEEVAACHPPEGQRHIDRYLWAKKRVRGERVLDCACGCGFGSFILSKNPRVKSVLGVDVDMAAIEYARTYYQLGDFGTDLFYKILFDRGDMLALAERYNPSSINTIVSLESLEHVDDPTIILNQFKKLLIPGGNIIASLPVIPTVHFNPYHKFEVASLAAGKAFFELNGFRVVDSWNQDVEYGIYEMEVAE